MGIIHLHQDNFQPGPVGNRIMPASNKVGPPGVMTFESGLDYSDDEDDTVDEDVIPTKDVIPNEDEIPDGNEIPMGEVELDDEGSVSGDQSRETKVVEAGDDYSDYYGAARRDGGRGRRRGYRMPCWSPLCPVDWVS